MRWTYFETLRTSRPRPAPRSRPLKRICSLASRTYSLGDRNAAAAAAEAALAAAEPDRLIFPFAMTGAAELLDALPRHKTAHGALLADIVDVLRGEPAPSAEGELLSPPEELSPSELRVLRYLPTNLTRPEIARELYLSVHTVNTHIRNIYSKLGAHNRSSAIRRARELRLLSTGRSRTSPKWRGAPARPIAGFRCRGLTRSGCSMTAWPHRRACTRSG